MYRYPAAVVLFAAVFLTTYCKVVVQQFEDRIDLEAALDAPTVASRILARPLRLEAGLSIDRAVLRDHLDRLRLRRVTAVQAGDSSGATEVEASLIRGIRVAAA